VRTRAPFRRPSVVTLPLFLLSALSTLIAAGGAQAQMIEAPALPPAPPPAGGQIDAAKLSKVPKLKRFVEAEYPKEALDKGITADVLLLIDIAADGTVDSVGIAEPVNAPGMGFEEAATIAAQQFEFEPAEMDGKPIAVQINYRYHFKLTPKTPTTTTTPAPAAPPPEVAAPPPPPAPAAPARQPVVNFSGQLRERGTRLPMAGVLVTVFRDDGPAPVGFEASADATGAFRLVDLAPGEWKVLIEAPGYYPFRTTEEIHAGEAVTVTYYVEKGSYNPYDVTVTATRPRKEVSRTVITAAEIDKVPGTAGDPISVVQNFAGVARAPLLSGQIIVRGSAPQDTLVFLDGTEIPFIYHFGGLRSVIPIGMLDSLEFYPGNFSPTYGRAIGGIIDVQVKRLQPKKISGYADVSILDTSVYLEAPLGNKGGVAIAGRRSYLGTVLGAAIPSDVANLTVAPRYYDYQLVANYRPAPAHDLRAFFLGSDDRFEILFKDPGDISTQVSSNSFSTSTTFYRSILTYRYLPGNGFENMAQVSQGRTKTAANLGQLTFDLDIYSSQLRDTAKKKLADWGTLSLGADVAFSKTSGLVRLPPPPKEGQPPPPFDINQLIETRFADVIYWSPAGFAELELRPRPGLLILPGVRADYFTRVHEGVVQPRITARYQLGERFTLKGGAGLFAQEPTFDETDPAFGNPKLKTQRALHYSAGTEFKPRPYLTFDATVFYKDMSHMVSRTGAQYTDDDGGVLRPLRYDNNGLGRAYGLELVARHDFAHNLTGWVAYTLSRSERLDSGNTAYRLFDFDQTHILTVLGSYTLPRNWQVGGRFRFVTGNPTTPVVGAVFNASRDEYDPIYGQVNSGRIAAFHQLDVRVDKRWVYQSWMLDVYLDIQNIYNRANPEGQSYNYNFRKSQVQQGLPILPILGVRADF
jgi:TonB family protein